MKLLRVLRNSFVFVLCCWSFQAFAQPATRFDGYYITAQGDSVTGIMDFAHFNYEFIFFQRSGTTTWKEIKAKDLLRAGNNSDVYIRSHEIKVKEDTMDVLLLRVSDGFYDLYEGKTADKGYFYFIAAEDRPTPLWVNERAMKAQLTAYFGKCADQLPANLHSTLPAMKSIVEKMNRCVRPNAPSSAVRTPRFRPQIGVGVNAFGYYTHNWVDQEPYHNLWNGGAGAMLRLKVLPSLSIDMGFNYVRKIFENDSVQWKTSATIPAVGPDGQSYLVYIEYHYKVNNRTDFRYLQIPLGVTANLLPQKKTNIVLSGGISFEVPLRATLQNSVIRPYTMKRSYAFVTPDEKGDIIVPEVEFTKRFFPGFYLSAGLAHKIGLHNELLLNVNYFRDKAFVKADPIYYRGKQAYQTHRYQITAGAMHYFGK